MILKNLERAKKEFEKIKKNQEVERVKKIQLILQKNNIKIAFFEDVKNEVVEVLNRYEGKQAGEKTKEKIEKEISEKFDNNIFVFLYKSEYGGASFTITTKDATGKYSGNEKIEIYSKNYNNQIINDKNQINKINIDDLVVDGVSNFIKDTKKAANQIIKLHEEAKELQEQINKKSRQIRDLTNGEYNPVEYCSCVSYWG